MKTTQLKFVLFLILTSLTFNASIAQNYLDSSAPGVEESKSMFSYIVLDDLKAGGDIESIEDKAFTVDYYETAQGPVEEALFALSMIAFGVGVGFVDSDTSWCLHGSYYMRLALYTATALYAALGIAYSGLSGDNNFSQSILDFSLKLLFFTAITQYKNIRLIYGLLFAYAIGNNKYNNFKDDITRLTVGLVMGLSFMLSPVWSLMLQTNPFAWISQKTKPDGSSDNESTYNFTSVLFNKQNVFAISLVYRFALASRRQ